MRVALPNLRNTGLRAERRLDELAAIVQRITDATAIDLVVFPELSACGYPAHLSVETDRRLVDEVSEPLADGPSAQVLSALARERQCAIVYGISERIGDRVFNTIALSDGRGFVTGYRKVHLTPAERELWSGGETAVVADVFIGGAAVRIGLSSCYDKAFPLIFQRQREQGARVSVIASAWSSHPNAVAARDDVWAMQSRVFDRARAAETGMVVVSANYHGPKVPGSTKRFCGGARVVDGLGWEVDVLDVVEGVPIWDVDLNAQQSAVDQLGDDEAGGRDQSAPF